MMPEMICENPMYRLGIRLRWRRQMFWLMPAASSTLVVLGAFTAWLLAESPARGAVLVLGALSLMLPLGVAAETAGGMLAERRRGSIDSLLLTPLTNWEILRGVFLACAVPPLFSVLLAAAVCALLAWRDLWSAAMVPALVFVGLSGCYYAGALGLLFGARIRDLKYAAAPVAAACGMYAPLLALGLLAVAVWLATSSLGVAHAIACADVLLCLGFTPAVAIVALRSLRPS